MSRFRFSIRTLALVVTLICLLLGAPISYIRYQASQQRRALSRLKELGITPYWYPTDWQAPSWATAQVRRFVDADAFQRYANVGIPADSPDVDEAIRLIAQLNGLEGVGSGSPNLSEKHVRALLAIPALNKLSVSKANLSSDFVREVIHDRQWKELLFSEIEFDDAMLRDLSAQKELSRVFFDASAASAPALEGLANCPKLNTVLAHRCNCAGAVAKVARNVPSMKEVYIKDSTVNAAEMREFADVGGIRDLNFERCAIESTDVEILKTSPNLRRLEFRQTKISMANLKGIVTHPALEQLSLDGAFTDADAEQLANLPVIESIAFFSCDLTDAGLQHFAKAKTLTSLILPKATRCTAEGIRRFQAKLPVDVYVGDLGEHILEEATLYEAGGVVRAWTHPARGGGR